MNMQVLDVMDVVVAEGGQRRSLPAGTSGAEPQHD